MISSMSAVKLARSIRITHFALSTAVSSRNCELQDNAFTAYVNEHLKDFIQGSFHSPVPSQLYAIVPSNAILTRKIQDLLSHSPVPHA